VDFMRRWLAHGPDGSARPAKAGLTTEQSVGRLGALAMAAARAPCSFGRTGTQLLGRECQRLDGAPGPGEDDSTFGGVHQQRRAAGSFVRLQADLPEKACERVACGLEHLIRPFEGAGLLRPGHGPGYGAAGAETSAFDHTLPDSHVTGDHVVRILRVNRADLFLHTLPGVVDGELDQLRTTLGEVMVNRPARRPSAPPARREWTCPRGPAPRSAATPPGSSGL
jgi:hypothetical protein